MIGDEQQNEVAQQIKKLELATDSDSGFERSNGSSNQSGNSRSEAEDTKKWVKPTSFFPKNYSANKHPFQ